MTWTGAGDELRQLLSDGPTDKLRYRKRCIGLVNGTNKTFKTFEFRRVTPFLTAAAPEGVYVDGLAATVSADFPSVGEFTLSSAPADGSVVEATYTIQWFLDIELDTFLKRSAEWLLIGDDYTKIQEGLRPAAKFYAAKLACEKLAIRWAESISETFMMEDAPREDNRMPINQYAALAKQYHQQAMDARTSFYTRAGQNLQPLFGVALGNVKDAVPKR